MSLSVHLSVVHNVFFTNEMETCIVFAIEMRNNVQSALHNFTGYMISKYGMEFGR